METKSPLPSKNNTNNVRPSQRDRLHRLFASTWKHRAVAVVILLSFYVQGFSASGIGIQQPGVQVSPIDSISFRLLDDNRIYTYCKINDSDSLLFLIDTGASDVVLNSDKIAGINITFDQQVSNTGTTGSGTVSASVNNTVAFGRQVVHGIRIISIPYSNERWDGVLGLSVLRQYVVRFDYDRMKIYLYDKSTYTNTSEHRQKITYRQGVPFIKVIVNTLDHKKRELYLEIDTGSDRIIDISTSYVNKNQLLQVYKTAFATSTVASSNGTKGVIFNVFFPSVHFAGWEFYQIPGGVAQIQEGIMNIPGIDGMIGNWFLKRFNLTFDFEHHYLYAEPNNLVHTPYYDFLVKQH